MFCFSKPSPPTISIFSELAGKLICCLFHSLSVKAIISKPRSFLTHSGALGTNSSKSTFFITIFAVFLSVASSTKSKCVSSFLISVNFRLEYLLKFFPNGAGLAG